MKQYLELMRRIRTEGVRKDDRTGTGTLSVFAQQMRFDLARGFPLVTTRKIHVRSMVYELLWFLRGDTNVAWLREHGVTIWDDGQMRTASWARSTAASGAPGRQPTDAPSTRSPRRSSGSKPILIRAASWSAPGTWVSSSACGSCPAMRFSSCTWPPDACPASSTSAARMCFSAYHSTSPATRCSRTCSRSNAISSPASSFWTGGDCHLYLNHLEQADLQLARTPFALPQLLIRRRPASIFAYQYEDFEFVNYQHHAPISAPVAV